MSKLAKAPKPGFKALGPVDDLERHVAPDWWRKIFSSLYLKTDGDVVNDDRITQGEVDFFIEQLKIQPETRILDLCCGQGRHTLELARRGHLAEGFDRSHYLIRKAKAQARKENILVPFKEGDARKLPYADGSFDLVMILGNSFGYFESTLDDQKVLAQVFRILANGGRILLDIADGERLKSSFNPRVWEWIDQKMFVCRERSLSSDGQRLISREVITDTEKGVVADQFYAERLYSKEEIQALLVQSGFDKVAFHGILTPASMRNQDLGMMESRFVLTAEVKKKPPTSLSKKKRDKTTVAVLLGDPKRPDSLKPFAKFDEDDFFTIDKMKEALSSLKGYEFSYITDHGGLAFEFNRLHNRVDLVLNLCDEGFNNEAAKELHIPALLEMLDLPYSGSGPQCLAFCYDKSLTRGIANEMGIPVPRASFIDPSDDMVKLPFEFPVIVKPNQGDSSFGITQNSVAYDKEQLIDAISGIRDKFGYEQPLLVEEFLEGKDLSFGLIGNPKASCCILPIIEEDYSLLPSGLPRICGYEAKWQPDSPYWKIGSIRAELPPETEKIIESCSVKLFERLGCRDYCRFDWRLDRKGNPKLLEVNPNPGWCWDGHLAKMAQLIDIPYPKMLEMIVQVALARAEQSRIKTLDIPS